MKRDKVSLKVTDSVPFSGKGGVYMHLTKDSKITWVGEIPEHWKAQKLKYIARITLGKMLTSEDKGGYHLKPYLRAANINWLNVDISDVKEMWFSESEMETCRITANDLLVSEGGEVGRTCIWNDELDECYIQNSVHKVTLLKDNNPRYFLYQFFIMGNIGFFDSIANRISIAHLTVEKLREVSFVVPPRIEQNRIASALDKAIGRIDSLIAAKEKLLKLLDEKKQALITKAVTKGLHPKVKMKETGVEWLRKVPEKWKLLKLKYFVNKIDEFVDSADNIIAVENIESKTGKLLNTTEQNKYEGALSRFQSGDVIFNKLRPYLAKVFLAESEGACVGELLILRPTGAMISQFLFYRLISTDFISVVDSSTVGAKMPRANWETFIKEQIIAVPPLSEQVLISDFLSKEVKKIDDLKSYTARSIALLKEKKSALITLTVTGQN